MFKTLNYFIMHCLKFSLKKRKNEIITKNVPIIFIQSIKEFKIDKLNSLGNFSEYKITLKKTNDLNLVKSMEYQKLMLNINKLKQIDMKITFELYR